MLHLHQEANVRPEIQYARYCTNTWKKRQSLLLKLSIRSVSALHYNAWLLREGIACSRCARLGAKGLHACQRLQECKSFTSVLEGGDAHPESTVCSLLPALWRGQGVRHRLESPPAESPHVVSSQERLLASFNIISDLIIQQRNKIQNKYSHMWIHYTSALAQLPFIWQLKDLVEKNRL